MTIKPIEISLIDSIYDEWQIAEGDAHMASDTEDASYHIGQADAYRDVFIRLSKEQDPEFDFTKFCVEMLLKDENFLGAPSEATDADA